LILQYRGKEVGRLSMDFLHHGIPMPTRKAVVTEKAAPQRGTGAPPVNHWRGAHATVKDRLLSLLAHPNIASKHWIIRQYDHEVQGGSVIKPLTGPLQIGPSDAAVLRPKLGSQRGIAIGCGLAPQIEDPYEMALAAIDEAIRNVVAVGADPAKIAILDNFCWPSVDDERTMGTLVRACEACRDAALAYGIPFISGKDSLHNQFTNSETGEVIRIPNTLLISAIGVIEDVRKCVTMDLKQPGNAIALLSTQTVRPSELADLHRSLAEAIRSGLVVSCHDCSEGGAAVAGAEMCLASELGLNLNADSAAEIFSESSGRYLIECETQNLKHLSGLTGSRMQSKGKVTSEPRLRLMIGGDSTEIAADELRRAWRGTLDW
jgi:phosphoribosylformylglycinamidine synthase